CWLEILWQRWEAVESQNCGSPLRKATLRRGASMSAMAGNCYRPFLATRHRATTFGGSCLRILIAEPAPKPLPTLGSAERRSRQQCDMKQLMRYIGLRRNPM